MFLFLIHPYLTLTGSEPEILGRDPYTMKMGLNMVTVMNTRAIDPRG
jgi:hypothetical protein